jgi:Resolvase, N terminal domain
MTETDASDANVAVNNASPGWPVAPAGILIGYARCSTERQDLSAQREILRSLGVVEERVYLDHGLTGTNRSRPGLNSALAALREGDTLVVPELDRLARSVPDARAIGDSLEARGVRLSLGGSVYDPSDPMASAFSTSSRRSLSSRSTCCECAPAKGWRSPAPKADSKAKPPSSAQPNALSCSSSTGLGNTRSPRGPKDP